MQLFLLIRRWWTAVKKLKGVFVTVNAVGNQPKGDLAELGQQQQPAGSVWAIKITTPYASKKPTASHTLQVSGHDQ
jgi:hypothetical protein